MTRRFDVLLILWGIVITWVVFGLGGIDLAVEHVCYNPAGGGIWRGENSSLIWLLYRYGPLPAVILGIASAAIAVGAIWVRSWRGWWREALTVALSLALGPGLMVNLLCKDHVGRPRPREVVGLGGDLSYVQPATRSDAGGHSFPSGHAAAGFSVCSMFIILRERRRRSSWIALACALAYGGALGYARISVGAHFPSDVLWSLWICYGTSWVVWALICRWTTNSQDRTEALTRTSTAAGVGPA